MTALAPTSGTTAVSLTPTTQTDRQKLSATAKQFEAIFVRQMLASARAVDFGGDDVFGQMDQTFVQMRDERFAEIASQTGALGLAAQIERHLAALLPPEAAPEAGKA
ncbi:flagellar biosynthesis protein FlgJ [Novosphingobium sp. SL115]|uniref:flagellar biosynthesis protein FlgJ n=1 Tax=Novosphingobium sp. SL115 TaxID=2995150 RepID=UPI0022724167|nr:flagellar biosynthesis protein FlgJ [Novosphingobium sp. SL115]MCY1670010.1 flagellar biosynthesis protein FlgJ [Novosphingobium sp. SL115]